MSKLTKQTIAQWAMDGLRLRNITQAELARLTGLSKATITRLLGRDSAYTATPAIDQVMKVADALRIPPPDIFGRQGAQQGFSEPDVVRLDPLENADINISRWRLKSDALAGAGYLPGDELTFDARVKPERGDVVIAQVYRRGDADTVIRIYMPPFLVAAEAGRTTIAPIQIDAHHNNAVIMATMVNLNRTRHRAA